MTVKIYTDCAVVFCRVAMMNAEMRRINAVIKSKYGLLAVFFRIRREARA